MGKNGYWFGVRNARPRICMVGEKGGKGEVRKDKIRERGNREKGMEGRRGMERKG